MDLNSIAAVLRQQKAQIDRLAAEVAALRSMPQRPRTVEEEIDSEPGRRIFYNFVQTQAFTTADDGKRGNAMQFLVSQDGPFIMTHYPIAVWKPSLPANATDFGRWRPVSSFPSSMGLPAQDSTLGIQADIIDISYELVDGGSQRQLQNIAAPFVMLSTVDEHKKLPKPTRFEPNTTIQFIPTYENIVFGGSTATTQGTLVVVLPGYRIVGNIHS